MYKWEFPSNNHGRTYGINDTGIETFKGMDAFFALQVQFPAPKSF